jgi:hypothetical protein
MVVSWGPGPNRDITVIGYKTFLVVVDAECTTRHAGARAGPSVWPTYSGAHPVCARPARVCAGRASTGTTHRLRDGVDEEASGGGVGRSGGQQRQLDPSRAFNVQLGAFASTRIKQLQES